MIKRIKTNQQRKFERLKRNSAYGKNWDQIRKLVYKRDGYKCRACGVKGKKLSAHHILLLKVSKTNDIRNLITLCDSCHKEIEAKALRLLKSGGHRKDVVRMTYRWLISKKAETLKR